ncbi:hypothetical protein ACFY0A_28690 [Streptomyces sp. NPDC001698]
MKAQAPYKSASAPADANCNQSSGTATPPIYDQYKNTVTGSSAE